LVAEAKRPCKPLAARGSQAALSSTLGAFKTPAVWHEVQTAVKTCSPVRATGAMDLSTVTTVPIGCKLVLAAASNILVSAAPTVAFWWIVLNKFDTSTAAAVPRITKLPIITGLA
jgi:hypothetical protein